MPVLATSHTRRFEQAKRLLITASQRQLLVGAGIAIARVAGFGTGVLAARALSKASFATYTLAFAVVTSLMQVTSFADTWLVSRWHGSDGNAAQIGQTVWSIKLWVHTLLLLIATLLAFVVLSWVVAIGLDRWSLIVAVLAAGGGALTS